MPIFIVNKHVFLSERSQRLTPNAKEVRVTGVDVVPQGVDMAPHEVARRKWFVGFIEETPTGQFVATNFALFTFRRSDWKQLDTKVFTTEDAALTWIKTQTFSVLEVLPA